MSWHSDPLLPSENIRDFIKHKGAQQDFKFILDCIQSKLAGWKANLLSLAGRIILTKSVTSTIPNYMMQCVALPPKIL